MHSTEPRSSTGKLGNGDPPRVRVVALRPRARARERGIQQESAGLAQARLDVRNARRRRCGTLARHMGRVAAAGGAGAARLARAAARQQAPFRCPDWARFAFAFHAAALVLVLPALLSSPWTARFPWIVVNLSWFHLGYLAAGALLFVPLALRPDSAGLRRWMPAFTVGVAVVVALWTAFSDAAPARGVREGFEWVARVDSFMARIGRVAAARARR
jgi:hypothetical protein